MYSVNCTVYSMCNTAFVMVVIVAKYVHKYPVPTVITHN